MLDVSPALLAFSFFTFVLSGLVKGVTGMGLPTVAMGMLALWLSPREAAALMLLPALITNVWQFVAGPSPLGAIRRFWPMMTALFLVAAATAGLVTGEAARHASFALGLVLAVYGVFGLSGRTLTASSRSERWLLAPIGLATGVLTGTTGVSTLPSAIYLQALDLDRDDLVQALGLTFTVASFALLLGLGVSGGLSAGSLGASLAALVPAAIGMAAGQWLRGVISPTLFKKVFFAGLLMMGLFLIVEQTVLKH